MQFVAQLYGCSIDQCNFAEELWQTTYGTDGNCCPNGGGLCSLIAPNVSQYKDAMQRNLFDVMLAANGNILNALTATGLRDDLVCAGIPAVLCFGGGASPLGSGHVGTIYGILDIGPSNEWLCAVMDPARGNIAPTYGNLLNNAFPGGVWFRTLPVTYVNCNLLGVGDIASFSVSGSDHNVNLAFAIQGGANPNQYAAVYVSDNPLGPALLIDALTSNATLMPGVNQWIDFLRLPPAGSYYYWLDYDDEPFALKRSPKGLYPAGNAPVFVSGGSFSGFSPPTITSIVDTPLDRGGTVTVSWAAPNGYEEADGFNVYRHTHPGGEPSIGEWEVVGWTDQYSLSYVDNAVSTEWMNDYKVSLAHHGNSTPQSGDGNVGIWNSFSAVVAGSAIDNFATGEITLVSSDTLRVCPAGDDGTIEVEEMFLGNVGGPTIGVPAEMLVCNVGGQSVGACDGDALGADGPTDAAGRTTLTVDRIGGHGSVDLVFGLDDGYTVFDTKTVYLKSPDENGDGVVSAADFAAWGTSFPSPPKPYIWFRDFDGNGSISVGDFAYFGSHYGHMCGPAAAATSTAKAPSSQGRLRLEVEEEQPLIGQHMIRAKIVLEGMEPLSTAIIVLKNENAVIDFVGWTPDPSIRGLALCSDIVRDGTRQVFIGLLLDQQSSASEITIGTAEFAVASSGPLNLTEQDFELVAGDILATPSTVSTNANHRQLSLTNRRLSVMPPTYKNELAQNYPNPFNPTTTVAFSVAKDMNVNLQIYDVRGAAVKTLANERYQAGVHRLDWDGRNDRGQAVASGVYFYKLVAGSFTDTKKMTILK